MDNLVAADAVEKRQASRLSALDGLRGVAALAVLQYHAHDLYGFKLSSSYLAVDFFFLLSGLVISQAYDRRLETGLSPQRFIAMRLVRLYPLYLLGTLLGALFVLANFMLGKASLEGFGATLFFSLLFIPTPQNTLPGNLDIFPFLYPAWSLFFELVVNILYALLFPILRVPVLLAIMAGGAVLVLWSAYQFGSLNSGFNWSNFSGGFGRVAFSFFLGVLIQRWRFKWPGGSALALCSAVLLFAILAIDVPAAMRPVYDVAVTILVFPVIATVAATCDPGPRLRNLFLFLGGLSYAVYALHAPLLWWTMGAVPMRCRWPTSKNSAIAMPCHKGSNHRDHRIVASHGISPAKTEYFSDFRYDFIHSPH